MSLVRIDPITLKHVVFTFKRDDRPRDLFSMKSFGIVENNNLYEKDCPFCKGNEEHTPASRKGYPENDWKVSIVPNKYPIICDDEDDTVCSNGKYSYNSEGYHDVIVESDLHYKTYFNMSLDEFIFLYDAIHKRYVELSRKKEIDFVCFFKNYQTMAGASLYHTHSQMMALKATPDTILNEINGTKRYMSKYGKCPYCEMVEKCLDSKERLIANNEKFVVLSPYAPRYKYETWIIPVNHSPFFEKEEDIKSLADMIYIAFRMLYNTIGNFAYNFYLHSTPANISDDKYHYHFEIIPRLSGGAGFEMCSGIGVNSLLPEDATKNIILSNRGKNLYG